MGSGGMLWGDIMGYCVLCYKLFLMNCMYYFNVMYGKIKHLMYYIILNVILK